MIDPIADMLTRIRNASLVKKKDLVLPLSKVKLNIAKILEKERYISSVVVISAGQELQKNKTSKFDQIKISLKYNEDGSSRIKSLTRISKPGRRVYVGKDEIPRVLNNFGISIISTSSGIMTGRDAKKNNIGGELICEIY